MRCLLFILSLSFFLIQPLTAQDNRLANPNISALIDGIDDEETKSDDLRLRNLSMRFDIYGQIGQGEIEATLYNVGDEELEGKFEFMLPLGAVVTGYAIDLENGKRGQLIDGVLLEKEKAKRTYENQVRGQVDPGLANVSREGVFTTQIYPINPEDTRSLRVQFSFAIDGNYGLQLPIVTDHEVENWDIEVSVDGVLQKPDMAIFNAVDVRRTSGKYNLTASGANERLDGVLRIAPVSAAHILISKYDNGEQFVQLSGNFPAASNKVGSPERIRLMWDKSRSRRDDNLDLEIGLAMQLIAGLNPNDIDTIYYNDSSIEIGGTNNYGELEKSLRSISYIGASSFKLVGTNILPKANLCLMFTDGIETIDIGTEIDLDCILHIISSSPRANDAELSAKAHKYGGSFHRLNKNSDKLSIISKILNNAPIVKSVKDSAGNTLDFVNLPAKHGKYALAAKLKNKNDTLFNIIISPQNITHKLSADSETNNHNGAASLWASHQLDRRENDVDRASFLAFARQYSVEASSLSFLVLEEAQDYVNADIAPPKSYPAELMEKFVEERKEADEEEAKIRKNRFAQLLDDWEELKEWWEKDYDEDDINAAFAQFAKKQDDVEEEIPEEADFIIVTGSRILPTIDIQIDAWQADRPYLKALEGREDKFATIYAQQERLYGNLPAFYLDMARWLHEKGRTQEAIPVLLSALELPSSNQETMAVVASRLQRYGQINRAIELLEFLAATDSDRPQYKRLLALAILRRAKINRSKADYQRSLDILYNIATDIFQRNDDRDIHLISLLEANAVLPNALGAGAKNPIDQRLVKLLDTDLRIVLEWDGEGGIIDLWVIEPTTEKAYYANRSTKIGGRISEDTDNGAGPEEYLIRNAISGDYEVRVNLYSQDRIDPNGAFIITARLIRNFGRPNESEESIDFELSGDIDDDKKIGVFTVSE